MQWSNSGNKFAVIGFNLHSKNVVNHPASGYSSVGSATGCINQRTRKRNTHNQCPPICIPPGCKTPNCKCAFFIANDEESIEDPNTILNLANTIPSCPPSLGQAQEDYRYIKLEGSSCYIWAFYESVGEKSFTKQCCYNGAGRYVQSLHKKISKKKSS